MKLHTKFDNQVVETTKYLICYSRIDLTTSFKSIKKYVDVKQLGFNIKELDNWKLEEMNYMIIKHYSSIILPKVKANLKKRMKESRISTLCDDIIKNFIKGWIAEKMVIKHLNDHKMHTETSKELDSKGIDIVVSYDHFCLVQVKPITSAGKSRSNYMCMVRSGVIGTPFMLYYEFKNNIFTISKKYLNKLILSCVS